MQGTERLAGKTVLITGGTSGIGAEVARACARESAFVVVAGRNAERGQEVVGEIEGAGGSAEFALADLSTVAGCRTLAEDVIERRDGIDVLINSAGVYEPKPTGAVTEEYFQTTFDINVRSVYFLGQTVLEHMRETGGGRVINISSIAGIVGAPESSVYCATKGAVLMLTKAWAVEYGPHDITVNCIAPGNVDSPMNAHLTADPDVLDDWIAKTPSGRNGKPRDIAPAAVLLAGEEGAFFQGSCLVIDGGWTAQ
jgi:NAD(P)-dependent dehydrogenase (short-subunit alcohol dehydrogenase family)